MQSKLLSFSYKLKTYENLETVFLHGPFVEICRYFLLNKALAYETEKKKSPYVNL